LRIFVLKFNIVDNLKILNTISINTLSQLFSTLKVFYLIPLYLNSVQKHINFFENLLMFKSTKQYEFLLKNSKLSQDQFFITYILENSPIFVALPGDKKQDILKNVLVKDLSLEQDKLKVY
jgi:hypothetical protein